MNRTILSIDIKPEFKKHLDNVAVKKGTTLSKYVRAALIKISKFKEKEIV